MKKKEYQVGQLVWAKESGKERWPAVVKSIKDGSEPGTKEATVHKFGSNSSESYVALPTDRLIPFKKKEMITNDEVDFLLVYATISANKVFKKQSKYEGNSILLTLRRNEGLGAR